MSSFVLQAQASKAKIIGIAAGPPNNVNEIKTGGEFGIFKGGQQMAALLALITDVHSLGLPTAQGLLLTTSFYWDMDDKTREWSKRYFAKMNRMPTMWQAGVYSATMHYLQAIKDAGTDDPRVADRLHNKRHRIDHRAEHQTAEGESHGAAAPQRRQRAARSVGAHQHQKIKAEHGRRQHQRQRHHRRNPFLPPRFRPRQPPCDRRADDQQDQRGNRRQLDGQPHRLPDIGREIGHGRALLCARRAV